MIVEQKISNFVESQFPAFYAEEGPNFMLFMKAYYEWMETQGQPIHEAREIFDYRDIDTTLDSFLEHFQKKYLYGIPFNVIINKRFLLKHILDVYRSKGSVQCYRLLFKLLYNQDVEVYLPGRDLLKPSDGTWVEPRYLEITIINGIEEFIGKKIVGISSGTTAVVESYITEPINNNILASLFISNIEPRGGAFILGEKVCIESATSAADVQAAPTVTGSLDYVEILNGGQGFNIGDVLRIAHRNPTNNAIISSGVDGELKVTGVQRGQGTITFSIQEGGFGFTSNALALVYNGPADTTGSNASFTVGAISSTQDLQYNTDLLIDHYNQTMDSTNFNFPGNATSNATTAMNTYMSFSNASFGKIAALSNIQTGQNYTQPAVPFVRSTQLSKALTGSVTYSPASNTITGTSTLFSTYFANGDVIGLRANSALGTTEEYLVIKQVTNATSMVLYGPTKYTSTASAQYKAAPVILISQFAPYESVMVLGDGTTPGINEVIASQPSIGSQIVASAIAMDSGRGYVDGEQISAYLTRGLATPTVLAGGNNYSNGEQLVFAGGGTPSVATGFITTNSTGGVVAGVLTYGGSGYGNIPEVRIKTKNGSGAKLVTSIVELNTFSEVVARVKKSGVGRKRGSWSTTQSFLNADKYIQDSFFYQDFSYQIKVASTLDKYKNILYSTFHPAGSEMFGQFQLISTESAPAAVLYESSTAAIS